MNATKGEWENILMMPTYPTLVACTDLTSNFRVVYVAVTHDVMLRRMKKAAYHFAQQTLW